MRNFEHVNPNRIKEMLKENFGLSDAEVATIFDRAGSSLAYPNNFEWAQALRVEAERAISGRPGPGDLSLLTTVKARAL